MLRVTRITIDLKDLHQLDAAGIGALVFTYTAAKSIGATVSLLNTPDFASKLLMLTRINTVFG
jgi:anti-anti-sigma regulatory factor